MTKIQWTSSQRDAIETVGKNVLVSAGAGSGKTAVLAERCARLMADSSAKCGVERFLVVTFTDAAAAEMRERIGLALRRRLEERPDDAWIARQLALLDSAAISTLHSFCKRTLNRHFADVDLDPQTPIMDEQEATLLRKETARQTLEEAAAASSPRGEAVLSFLGEYGSMGDRRVLDAMQSLNAFLASLPEPDKWCAEAMARYDGDGSNWRQAWVNALRAELVEQLEAVSAIVSSLGRVAAKVGTAGEKLLGWIEPYRAMLEAWHASVSVDGVGEKMTDLVAEQIAAFKFDRLDFVRWTKESPVEVLPELESWRDELKAVKEKYHAGRLKKEFGGVTWSARVKGIQRIAPHVKTFFNIAEKARAAYADAKRAAGAIDFADLERYMLDLLKNDAAGVACRLRDRFEHVLVDEFQDINPVQAEIIRCVSREDDADRPGNLFCVGDVKQSIYRFRLAEPRVFMQRAEQYGDSRHGVRIDLADNFRSRPPVLEAVNAIFERIMSHDLGEIDYDDRARLKPGLTSDATFTAPPVELHLLEKPRRSGASTGESDDASDESPRESAVDEQDTLDDGGGEAIDWLQIEREAYVIGERIRKLSAEGVRYGDIVILLRSLKLRAGLLMRTLTRMGIPVRSEADAGLFEALETRDVLGLLSLLDNLQQDIPLAAVLRSPLLGDSLDDDALAMIRSGARDVSFHEAVREYSHEGRDSPLRARVAAKLDAIEFWRNRSRRMPLADLVWRLYDETGYFAYVSGLRDGGQRRANLICLHELARKFGEYQRQGLRRFLEFVAGISDAGNDLARGSTAGGNEDVVHVMSIHHSKGLEFPVVVIGELGKKFNFADAQQGVLIDRQLGVALKAVDLEQYVTYPTLPYRLVARSIRQETLAEELRVLYVAMTRAKQRIVLIGTGKLESIETNQRRFAGRTGPLPLLDRRSAQSMLDWVLPVICAVPIQQSNLFDTTTYAIDAMSQWQLDPPMRSESAERLNAAALLQPLADAGSALSSRSAASADDALVQVVRRRLTTPYAFAPLTRVPAVAAASVLKRRWETRQDAEEPAAEWTNKSDIESTKLDAALASAIADGRQSKSDQRAIKGRPMSAPIFTQKASRVDATRRGTLTHELMQRLDLTRACDEADVRAQLQALTEMGALADEDAVEIDVAAVAWFFASDLGRRLRRPSARVKREWPFVLSASATRYDPSIAIAPSGTGDAPDDQMLVRGIVDCLFDAGEGWEIVDYKTDAVSGAALIDRVAHYRGQLAIYSEALAATFGASISRRWLVFLAAREIVSVD